MALAGLRMRSGVLIAVCLAHVALILLLSDSTLGPRQRDEAARDVRQEPMVLVLIDDFIPERTLSVTPVSQGARVVLEVQSAVAAPSLPVFEITDPAPLPFDSSAELKRAATDMAENQIAHEAQVTRSRERLAGHAAGMALPKPEPREHHNGDTEHHTGETITWINERCYYSTAPRLGPDAGPLTLALPICKKRPPKNLPPPSKPFEHEEESIPLQADKNALPGLGGR